MQIPVFPFVPQFPQCQPRALPQRCPGCHPRPLKPGLCCPLCHACPHAVPHRPRTDTPGQELPAPGERRGQPGTGTGSPESPHAPGAVTADLSLSLAQAGKHLAAIRAGSASPAPVSPGPRVCPGSRRSGGRILPGFWGGFIGGNRCCLPPPPPLR